MLTSEERKRSKRKKFNKKKKHKKSKRTRWNTVSGRHNEVIGENTLLHLVMSGNVLYIRRHLQVQSVESHKKSIFSFIWSFIYPILSYSCYSFCQLEFVKGKGGRPRSIIVQANFFFIVAAVLYVSVLSLRPYCPVLPSVPFLAEVSEIKVPWWTLLPHYISFC